MLHHMTSNQTLITNQPKTYFVSNGGELTCSHHAGAYLMADLVARPKGRKFSTPLAVWERLSSAEVEAMFTDLGFCCETCKANEPTPIGTLDDSLIGKVVTVQSKRYGTQQSGIYEGSRPSQWDGEMYHYFRNGIIGDIPQGLHGYPVSHSDDNVLIAVKEVAQ